MTCNGCIVVIADGFISVFDMPILQPRIGHEKPPTIDHKPIYRLSYRKGVSNSCYLSKVWCIDKPPDEISNYISILHATTMGGSILDHYIFHRIDMPQSPTPHVSLVLSHEIHMPDVMMNEVAQLTWTSSEDLLLLFKRRSHLVPRLYTLPSQSGKFVTEYAECSMGPLSAEDDDYGFSYCAFSGRVVINDESRPGEIRVLDYLT